MRPRLATLALLALLGLAPGCFVFDEIDKGQELMKQHRPPAAEPASAEQTGAAQDEDEGPGLIARLRAFWDEKTAPREPERSADDSIVTCELSDGSTLTYESDCLSRGGRVR